MPRFRVGVLHSWIIEQWERSEDLHLNSPVICPRTTGVGSPWDALGPLAVEPSDKAAFCWLMSCSIWSRYWIRGVLCSIECRNACSLHLHCMNDNVRKNCLGSLAARLPLAMRWATASALGGVIQGPFISLPSRRICSLNLSRHEEHDRFNHTILAAYNSYMKRTLSSSYREDGQQPWKLS